MTLGHLSNLINKKIFSDDFDKSSFFTDQSWRKDRLKLGSTKSVIDDPIREEREPEFDNYLSDSSSSSQFSLQRRYLNLDISKLIDKLEPLDDSSAVASKYYGNVNETIEEEGSDHSDEFDARSRSHNSSSSYKRDGKSIQSTPFYTSLFPFGLGKRKMPKSRSLICFLESETIAEELEEYEYAPTAVNQTSHCFKLPQRLRFDSGESMHNEGGNSCPESSKPVEREEEQIDTSSKPNCLRRPPNEFKRTLTPVSGISPSESKPKRHHYAGLSRGQKMYGRPLTQLKDTTSLRSQRLNNSTNSLPTITEERKERQKTPKHAYGYDFFEKYSQDSRYHQGKSAHNQYCEGSCEDNLGDHPPSDDSISRIKMVSQSVSVMSASASAKPDDVI